MQTHLKNLIQTIKTGSQSEVKLAQRHVEKFWSNYYIPHREEGRQAFSIFLKELEIFAQIKDIDHQAYFINTLKWPLWSIGEENFEEWADFLLNNIQHPSGKIRQAVLHATEYLISDIKVDLRHFGETSKDLTPKMVELVARNRMWFGYFVMAAEDLIERYFEPRFKKYKYVSSLPAGVHKSLCKLMTEVLLRSEFYEKLYQDFLNELRAKRKGFDLPKITLVDIYNKREEIEEEMAELIETTSSILKMDDIKDIIYNEDGQDSMHKIVANFVSGQSIGEMNRVFGIISNAWNYWPHKKLNGLSPAEKSLEYQ